MEQKGQISLVNAILGGMNIMIGAGILAVPSIITAAAGDIGILAWGVAIVFLPIVLSVMRLSQLIDRDGGIYAYSAAALGRLPGFIGGSLYYFGYTFAATAVISLLRPLMLAAFPGAFIFENLFAYYALAMSIIATLNLVSLSISNAISIPAIYLKFSPLLLVIASFPFASTYPISFDLSKIGALPGALTMTIFCFLGFEYALAIGKDIANREKNGPLAVIGAFLCTTVVYILFHIGLLKLMGAQNLLAGGVSSFANFMPIQSVMIKGGIALLVAVAIKLAYISSANGMTYGNISTLYGLAKDGLLRGSSMLSIVNSNNRPLVAGLIQFVMIFALGTLVTNVVALANLTNLAVLLVFVLSTLALLATLRKQAQCSTFDWIVGILGFCASSGLAGYSFFSLGATWAERAWAVSPLAGPVILSLLMYKPLLATINPIKPAAKQNTTF